MCFSFDVASLPLAVTVFLCASIYIFFCNKKLNLLGQKVKELEVSLTSSVEKCASERQGRVRAQMALRNTLAKPCGDSLVRSFYPMAPIGIVQSCFSTRNGTPRQPFLVPLARASVIFNSSRVPPSSLDGLAEYSHCWIIYVFHLNTDLDKLWREPSRSKIKAKVRVPRLKGGRKGLFATRSPHRPCPIGLTVAKVDEVRDDRVILSGVDLVDGTPVLDIKPYLPYCDSIQSAKVPEWVKNDEILAVATVSFSESFKSALHECWKASRESLYSSPEEFQSLVKQVLSWDIRSVSQRIRADESLSGEDDRDHGEVVYRVALEGFVVLYCVKESGEVLVENVLKLDATIA